MGKKAKIKPKVKPKKVDPRQGQKPSFICAACGTRVYDPWYRGRQPHYPETATRMICYDCACGVFEELQQTHCESPGELSLWLSVVGGYTQVEIGTIIGMGQRRVSRMMQRAIAACRKTGEIPEWLVTKGESRDRRRQP